MKEQILSPVSSEIDVLLPSPGQFLDREDLLARLEKLLKEDRPILLEGPNGIGKSTLALILARRLSSEEGPFKATFYFDIQEGPSVARVQDRLLLACQSQLHSHYQGWEDFDRERQIELLLEYLRSFPALLIVDHLHTQPGLSSEAVQELLEFLQSISGGLTRLILVAERAPESWFPQSPRVEVPGLPLHAAQLLAREILQTAGLAPGKMTALDSCQGLLSQLECNPLAMRIVIPDLLRQEPDTVLRRFTSQVSIGEARDILQQALHYRCSALDPLLRKRLAIFGLFRGCISARIITAMASLEDAPSLISSLDREEWLRLLETAGEMGLARRVGEGSFLMHPAIQEFLAELYRAELGVERAWLEKTYCQICGRAGNQIFKILQANPQFGQSLLFLEERNLMAAYQLALHNLDFPSLREILCGLRAALILQGRWTEWDVIVTQLESLLTNQDGRGNARDELLWLRLLGHRAEICEYQGDLDRLRRIHQQLVSQYSTEIQPHDHILDDLAAIAKALGLFEEANRFYLKSLALREQKGDEPGQARILMEIGELCFCQRKFRESEKWFLQSLETWTRLAQPKHQGILCLRLGDVARERGESAQAESWYLKSRLLPSADSS